MATALQTVLAARTSPRKQRDYSYLKPYQFKPGHAPLPGGGRPEGRKDAATIYLESLPTKARQWVRSTEPAILIDARKIALPLDADGNSASPNVVVVFTGDAQRLGNPLLDELAPQPVVAQALQNPQLTITP